MKNLIIKVNSYYKNCLIKSALPSLEEAKQSLIEIYQEGYPAMLAGSMTKLPATMNPYLAIASAAGMAASLAFDYFTKGDLGNDIAYLFEYFDKLKERSPDIYKKNENLYNQFIEKMRYIDWILFHYFGGRLRQLASSKQILSPDDIKTFDKLFVTALELFPIGEQEGGKLAEKVKSALLAERGMLGQGVSFMAGALSLEDDLLATTGLLPLVDSTLAFLDRVIKGIETPLLNSYKTYTDMLLTAQQQIKIVTEKQQSLESKKEESSESSESADLKNKQPVKENIPKGGLSEVGKGILSKLSQ